MALDQSALLELVEVLKACDDGELMRKMLTTMLRALIEAEATAHIGAGAVTAGACAALAKDVDASTAAPHCRRLDQQLRASGPDALHGYVTAVVDAAPPLTLGQVRRLRAQLSCDAEQARSGAPVHPAARTTSR